MHFISFNLFALLKGRALHWYTVLNYQTKLIHKAACAAFAKPEYKIITSEGYRKYKKSTLDFSGLFFSFVEHKTAFIKNDFILRVQWRLIM